MEKSLKIPEKDMAENDRHVDDHSFQIGVLEDNISDYRFLEKILLSINDQILNVCHFSAINGHDFFQLSDCDLCFVDYRLENGITGLDIMKIIKEINNDIVCIFFTGQGNEEVAAEVVRLGAHDYIIKGRQDTQKRIKTALMQAIRLIEEKRNRLEEEKLRKQAEFRNEYLAFHDYLTKLPNRALFFDRLSEAMKHADRYYSSMQLLYLDLDGFKAVNDFAGHEAGDAVLIETAKRFDQCIRQFDTLARIGGDEFAIILKDIHEKSNVLVVINKIMAQFQNLFYLKEHNFKLSVSIGVATYPDDAKQADELMRLADKALYMAKRGGKNQHAFIECDIMELIE